MRRNGTRRGRPRRVQAGIEVPGAGQRRVGAAHTTRHPIAGPLGRLMAHRTVGRKSRARQRRWDGCTGGSGRGGHGWGRAGRCGPADSALGRLPMPGAPPEDTRPAATCVCGLTYLVCPISATTDVSLHECGSPTVTRTTPRSNTRAAMHQPKTGVWAVTRYEAVRAALGNPRASPPSPSPSTHDEPGPVGGRSQGVRLRQGQAASAVVRNLMVPGTRSTFEDCGAAARPGSSSPAPSLRSFGR
jgi:hypothetical protein